MHYLRSLGFSKPVYKVIADRGFAQNYFVCTKIDIGCGKTKHVDISG
jgi:hypothetical protein